MHSFAGEGLLGLETVNAFEVSELARFRAHNGRGEVW